MTKVTHIRTLIFLALLSAFNYSYGQTETQNLDKKGDTTKSFKIANYWVTPKQTFELISVSDTTGDTLRLVSCAEYIYSPFGQINNKSELNSSLLKDFNIADKTIKKDNETFEFQVLKFNKSQIIMFFDKNLEASKHSYIFKGEIYDSNVTFLYDIKIGMTQEHFLNTFFDKYPKELMKKFKFICFESCVQDIIHTYSFKDNKLFSINFKTDSYWTIDY